MVKLVGTEKQIAWAEKIRRKKLEKLNKDLDFFTKQAEKLEKLGKKGLKAEMVLKGFTKTIEILENADDAATWIDLRWNSFTPGGGELAEETKRFLKGGS